MINASAILLQILQNLKTVCMYCIIYPTRNVYYTIISLINFFVPRNSTRSIIIIALVFYGVANLAKISAKSLQFDTSSGTVSIDSMPCFGIKDGCESVKIIMFACLLMSPFFFWNRHYLFGSTDCIDYNGMVDKIKIMMTELKKRRLNGKIDRTLDAVGMYASTERQYIKHKITAMKEPINQQIIDDRISLLKSKNIEWLTPSSRVNQDIERTFLTNLSRLEP